MSVDANRDAEMDEQTRTGTAGSTSLLVKCVFSREFHDDRLVYRLSAAVVGVPQATPPHRRRRSQSASPSVGQVISTRAGNNPLCLGRGQPGLRGAVDRFLHVHVPSRIHAMRSDSG